MHSDIARSILRNLNKRPFQPFRIEIRNDGTVTRYDILSAKHLSFNPSRTVLVIWLSTGDGVSYPIEWVRSVSCPATYEIIEGRPRLLQARN